MLRSRDPLCIWKYSFSKFEKDAAVWAFCMQQLTFHLTRFGLFFIFAWFVLVLKQKFVS